MPGSEHVCTFLGGFVVMSLGGSHVGSGLMTRVLRELD